MNKIFPDAALIQPPVEITADKFDEMLGVMPPTLWVRNGDDETFQLCEMYSENVCYIFARMGARYFALRDRNTLNHKQILTKIREAFP
ncbi:MAG: hypothetical protein WKG03_00460 [Telluria sp.]